jgi:membrane protease YdiL (CAAX protease family)
MSGDTLYFSMSAMASAVIGYFLWKWDVIRPGSFPPKRQRDVTGVPSAVWLLCAMMAFLAQIEGAVLAMRLPGSMLGTAESLRHDGVVTLGGYAAGIGAGVLMIMLLRPRVKSGSGLSFRWSDVGRGAVAMVLVSPFYIFVQYMSTAAAEMVSGQKPNVIAHGTLQRILDNQSSGWAWVIGGCAVLGAPVYEEMLHRVFVQSCFLRLLERTWPAILGASALFTAMHFTPGASVPWHALPPLFVLSVGMGVAYERTRGIATSMTMHVLFNGANVALALLMNR